MFKPGDRIVCIDVSEDTTTYEPYKNLKKHNSYIIRQYGDYFNTKSVKLFNIEGVFRDSRFISIKEYRKLKLNKLCLKKEIE